MGGVPVSFHLPCPRTGTPCGFPSKCKPIPFFISARLSTFQVGSFACFCAFSARQNFACLCMTRELFPWQRINPTTFEEGGEPSLHAGHRECREKGIPASEACLCVEATPLTAGEWNYPFVDSGLSRAENVVGGASPLHLYNDL